LIPNLYDRIFTKKGERGKGKGERVKGEKNKKED